MNMEDFAREARRLSEADYSAYDKERSLIRELLRSAAELGESILRQRELVKTPLPTEEIMELYNEICGMKLPKVRKYKKIYDKQLKSCRLRGFSKETFRKLFIEAVSSDFICGEAECCKIPRNFEWIIDPEHACDILNGKYRNWKKKKQGMAIPDESEYLEGF